MRAVALTELQSGPLGALMDPMETLKRVLAAMREDPKGLIKAPPPPSTQPSPEEITAQAKMLQAQNQGKKIEADAANQQTKAQQEQQAQDADIKGKTIDMAKELIIHKADQQKAAHDQGMDKAKHGLAVGQAAHKAALDTHSAVLQTAEAMKPEPEPEATGKATAKPNNGV